MKFGILKSTAVATIALVAGLSVSASVFADGYRSYNNDTVTFAANPDVTVLHLTSDITEGYISGFECTDGSITGNPADCGADINGNPLVANIKWTYHGRVFAPHVRDNGEEKGVDDLVGSVEGHPSFSGNFFALAGSWTGLPATMPWTCDSCTLKVNGSTFEHLDSIPLTGRAFISLGPIPNAENLLGMRMGGCSGIKAVDGDTGPYAGMQGTICLNGTIEFNQQFSGVGKSHCTVILAKP